MNKQFGNFNKNPFRINTVWDNNVSTNSVFPPYSGLFADDGTLLSFDLQYSDGYIASIALVPKNQWLEYGMDFIDGWLAPIGLTLASHSLSSNLKDSKLKESYKSLIDFAVKKGGGMAVNFLTRNVREHNLAYLNIYTKIIYKTSPLIYDPRLIF